MIGVLEGGVHGEGVRGDDGHADAGRRHLQVGDPEDLPGLVADLELLAGPAVVLARARPRDDVQRQRRRERRGPVAELVGDGPPDVARRRTERPVARRRPRARRSSRSTPGWPAPDAAWYDATTSSVSPNRRCSAPSASIIVSVVQLGLLMMPFGRVRDVRAGLTSGTTSGTSGSIRKAPELSTTTAPRSTAIGAHCGAHLVGHVEHRDVDAVEDLGGEREDLDLLAAHAQPLARRARPTRRGGSRPRRPRAGEDLEHHRADGAGGADDGEGGLAPLGLVRHRPVPP